MAELEHDIKRILEQGGPVKYSLTLGERYYHLDVPFRILETPNEVNPKWMRRFEGNFRGLLEERTFQFEVGWHTLNIEYAVISQACRIGDLPRGTVVAQVNKGYL